MSKPAAVADTSRESVTNWNLFEKLRLFPTRLECRGYKPLHPYDSSCHSKLRLRADSVLRHTEAQHGGGFRIGLKYIPEGAKPWSGWGDLRMLGMEIRHIRCAGCLKDIQMTPQDIQFHMSRHIDANKRSWDAKTFEFTVTLPGANPTAVPPDEE